MAPFFSNVLTTEVSTSMVEALQAKGFRYPDNHICSYPRSCIQTDSPHSDPVISSQSFDCISCLNVLDRCNKPITMLNGFRDLLNPEGVLVLAVVLPFCPFVESGAQQAKPLEKIKVIN